MFKISHKEFSALIKEYYKKKLALFCFGAFGIGKSFVVRDVAKDIGKERGREFFEWNKITKEKKQEIYNSPEKYFCLLDVRMSEQDSTDIKGLPDFSEGKEVVEWKIPFWAKYISLENSDGILFLDEFNLGCFKEDTTILTSEGYKKIKDVKKGEKVLDINGVFSSILETQKILYRGDIFKIKPTGIKELETTPNHPFLVIEKYRKANRKWGIKQVISKPIWKKAEELKKGDYVSIPIIKDLIEDKRINQNFAELLGYYTADGSYCKGSKNSYRVNLVFNKTEKYLAERVKEIVGLELNKNSSISKRENTFVVRFSIDKKTKEDFFDECGKGAKNKHIPNSILRNKNLSILKSFLYGYWKGDGCFVKNGITSFISFTTMSERLSFELQSAFARFGILTTINQDKKIREHILRGKIVKSGMSFIIRTPNKKLHNLFDLNFDNDRKTEHFFLYEDKIWTKIRKISKQEEDTYIYNFEVEKSNTYTANNVLTHNTPIVMSSFYKVLYDRCVNDEKMSDNWLVLGAGNRESDRGFTHAIPEPLLDRGGGCELVGSHIDDWCSNFAIPNKIDSRIIGYLNFKPSDLHKVDFSDNQKNTTERGWERVSNLIKGVKDYKTIELLCKSAIGEGIAISFIAFLKIQEKMKLDDVIKHPEKIEKIDKPDVKYFLISAVAEKYSDENNKQVDFNKVMEISKVLDSKSSEFTALLWRLCSSYNQEMFKKDFLNAKGIDSFITKYGKFIIS